MSARGRFFLLEASPADIRIEEGSAVVAGTSIGVPVPEIARIA